MVRRRQTDKYSLQQKRRRLLSLQMDAKIRALQAGQWETPPKAASWGERALLQELAAQRREAYFTARELELVNYQRDMVGLPPLKDFRQDFRQDFQPDTYPPPEDMTYRDSVQTASSHADTLFAQALNKKPDQRPGL